MICRPTHTLSLFLSLSFLLSLWRTRWVLLPLVLRVSLFSSWLKSNFLRSLDERTLLLFMFGKVYFYSNTHPLISSQIYPPSHKFHINTVFLRVRYQVKQTLKSHANSISDAIRHFPYPIKLNRLRRRPPAALRGFGIQVTVQNLFTTISSKTCYEHVHNLSQAVPFSVWYKIPVWFVFRTCFDSAISVRPRGTCESSRRSARR